jgi:hypothetical protein
MEDLRWMLLPRLKMATISSLLCGYHPLEQDLLAFQMLPTVLNKGGFGDWGTRRMVTMADKGVKGEMHDKGDKDWSTHHQTSLRRLLLMVVVWDREPELSGILGMFPAARVEMLELGVFAHAALVGPSVDLARREPSHSRPPQVCEHGKQRQVPHGVSRLQATWRASAASLSSTHCIQGASSRL